MEKFCCVVSWAADVCRDGHRSCILQGKVTKLNFVAMCHRQQSYGFKCGWRHSTCCGANSVASSWLRKGWVPFNKTFLKFFLFFKAVELSLFVRVTLYGCGCTPFNWILRKTYRKCSFNDRSRWFQIQKDICHLEDICIVFQLYIPTVNCAVLRTAMVWGEDVSVYNTFSYFFWSGMT